MVRPSAAAVKVDRSFVPVPFVSRRDYLFRWQRVLIVVPLLGTIIPIMSTIAPDHALFGRTRSALLALLFGHTDESFYLRQLIRAVGTGNGALQREI